MKLRYDKKVDSLYIKMWRGKAPIRQTYKLLDFLLVDIGEKEEIRGIEILEATKRIPVKKILKKLS